MATEYDWGELNRKQLPGEEDVIIELPLDQHSLTITREGDPGWPRRSISIVLTPAQVQVLLKQLVEKGVVPGLFLAPGVSEWKKEQFEALAKAHRSLNKSEAACAEAEPAPSANSNGATAIRE